MVFYFRRAGFDSPFIWEGFTLKACVVEKVLLHRQFSDETSEVLGTKENRMGANAHFTGKELARYSCLSSLILGLNVHQGRERWIQQPFLFSVTTLLKSGLQSQFLL